MRTWPTALAENPNPVAFCKTRTGPNNGMPPKGPSAIAEDERGRRVDPVRAERHRQSIGPRIARLKQALAVPSTPTVSSGGHRYDHDPTVDNDDIFV